MGVVQMAVSGDDKTANLAKATQAIQEARARGSHIVCVPELFQTSYFCQTEDPARFSLAEPVPGPTTEAFSDLARNLDVTIVASVFERSAPGVHFNTAVVLGPDGKLSGVYRKMHVPDDPCFQEKYYFTPGDLGFVVCQTPRAVVGPLVCYDQWFPEAARLASLKGAELLAYPTAIGWLADEKAEYGASQLDAWRTIQRSHAIANGVFVIAVNRVGHEPGPQGGIEFWGHSFVCDPFGVVLAEAGEGEEVLVVRCDLGSIDLVRQAWPFLRDRRIDAYGGLVSRLLVGSDPFGTRGTR